MNQIEQSKTQRLNELHGKILYGIRTTIELAIEAGSILTEVKESLPHGQFQQWVEENTAFDVRTAQRYMKAHRNRDRLKSDTVSFLGQLTDETKTSKSAPPDPIAAMFSWCPKVKASVSGIEILEALTTDEWEQLLKTASLLNDDTKSWIVGDLLKYGVGEGGQKSLFTPGEYTVELHCPQRWEKRTVQVSSVPIETIRVLDSAYCRSQVDFARVKRYTQTLAHLPPVELDDDKTLIDGRMRLEAFKAMNCDEIPAFYTDVEKELPEQFTKGREYSMKIKLLGTIRNVAHGDQLTEAELQKLDSA